MLQESPPTPTLEERLGIERRCGDCGYRLDGLRKPATCPECGIAEAPEQIVLFGWAAGPHHNMVGSRPWRAIVGVVLGQIGLILQAFIEWPRARRVAMFVAAELLCIATYAIFRRHDATAHGGAPYQLRLAPWGFATRNGVGKVKFRSWTRDATFTIGNLKGSRHRIEIERRTYLGGFRWLALKSEEIGFEFDCDAAAADTLRRSVAMFQVRAADRR